MKRFTSTILGTALAVGGAIALAPSAAAEERTCRGAIGAVTLDNVRVPAGATCTLTGTILKGTLKVERGATLTAQRVRVNGNIQSQAHKLVRVHDARVGGSIQVEQGATIDLRRNVVGGDVQVFSNRTGTKTIIGNRLDGNLQCTSNTPVPVGSGNIVKGNKEDQCRRL